MRRIFFNISILGAAILLLALSCKGQADPQQPVTPVRERPSLSDKEATAQTRALYENLIDLMDKGTMFGAQIPTEYGLDGGKKWVDDGSASNSDTKFLTGSHPAVCGWDFTRRRTSTASRSR